MPARSTALLALALLAPPALQAACPPAGMGAEDLATLRREGFKVDDAGRREALAIEWLDCLASPDPAWRDGGAYEALAAGLRGETFSARTRQDLMERLLASLQSPAPDPDGVRAPFEALVLSEIARTDRIAPWLDATQGQRLVDAAADYLAGVRDWRGFDARVGWRHGVAHGADLAMQLALNPALDRAQLDRLLAAVAAQVAPEAAPPYTHGEPERLVRPVAFALQRGLHDDAAWSAWLTTLVAAAPPAEANIDAAVLARRHNLRGFLFALYGTLATSGTPILEARAPAVADALRRMP